MPNPSQDLPLSIRDLTFTYRIREEPAIKNINLELLPGELKLIAGASGSGKTTLMRCVNGLIPRSYRGTMSGEISVFGQSIEKFSMAKLSQTVGTLLQNPERQIVASFVRNEVAFGLENLALPREEILSRVEESLEFLNILDLIDRETFSLSGGEKQKIALTGVLAMRPRILLLDEPLSSLDPASALESLQLFRRLADEGISILMVEHRVDDALAIKPDSVLYLEDGQVVYSGEPDGLMETADFHQIKLPAEIVMDRARKEPPPVYKPAVGLSNIGEVGDELLTFNKVNFRYGPDLPEVLHDVSFSIKKGDVVAILGPNGTGKTTLVKHALGLLKPVEGEVLLEGKDSRDSTVADAAKTVGYVFQNPGQMLFAPTVEEELAFGPKNLRYPEETIIENTNWALKTVNLEDYRHSPSLAMSYGQQKRVSIAAILSMRSRILIMDEPTAGQDYWNYRSFMDAILQMPGFDAVIFITHDLDLALIYANQILLLSGGSVAAYDAPEKVLQDEDLLKRCRVLPTSLLRLNTAHLAQTGRFMRAEELAHLVQP
jgi:energy-coupling factor transport system ATP-binding protein